jgi:hypothetical protein
MTEQLSPDNLSKSDFADVLKASYMNQRDAANYMSDRGYNYDKDLSTMEEKVFVNRATGKPVIAERGSVRLSDWLLEDPKILTGSLFDTRRVSNAKSLSKETEAKYGMAPTLVGHSLGGYLAEKGARKGSDVYTYNKGAGLPSLFSSTPKSQTDYRTTFDIPSSLSVFQSGNKNTLSGSWNPITSHNISYLK